MVRGAACFAELSDDLLRNVLDLLSGRYPSDEFNELRPRIVWDRVNGTLRARDGSKRLAIMSGGTIPDRGLFGVFLPDGTRVGELDEEMVYESRPGETFLLGASTWRIEDITFERVIVTPAPGQPGKMPFWHGDRPGRPLELGRALGAFQREVRAMPGDTALASLMDDYSLDALAATNVLMYLEEQAQSTGVVPDDRTVVIERFRDEIGDWRVCILSPFGTPVHAPWAMAIQRRLAERFDIPVEMMWTDDGIVLRLPEAADELPLDDLIIDPDDIDELVMDALPQTSLFAARFRECAARALLLPRRRPDQRTPLWQQRQRAADLLAVASKYPTFPMLLETSRECLQDVFDLPALREVLTQLRNRTVRVVSVDTAKASPFAQSLLFNWIAAYMYEGDAPLAERRAAALALDRDLLRDLLGAEELRELLDPGALADIELELQLLADGRRARSADELHDVLRRVGDLDARRDRPALRGHRLARRGWTSWCTTGGPSACRWRACERFIAADDAARYRDALGCNVPLGLPRAFTEPVPHPLESLVARYARTHGPFVVEDLAGRFGISVDRATGALVALEADGPRGARRVPAQRARVASGATTTCCARSAAARSPRCAARSSRSSPRRTRGSCRPGTGSAAIGAASRRWWRCSVSCRARPSWPARWRPSCCRPGCASYRPTDLDELCTSGELVWVGAGALGASDGRIRLCFADQLPLLAAGVGAASIRRTGALHDAIRAHLAAARRQLLERPPRRGRSPTATDTELLAALWDLVWAGEVTNDSLAPLRIDARLEGRGREGRAAKPGVRARARAPGASTASGRRWVPADGAWWRRCCSRRHRPPRPRTRTALQLLERYGVVTREAVLAEGVRRRVRRRVRRAEGAGGARPGAARLLRGGSGCGAVRPARCGRPAALGSRGRRCRAAPGDVPAPVVLAATDPAQPYGAAIAWPPVAGPSGARGAARRWCCAPACRWCGSTVARTPGHVPGRRTRRRLGRGARRAGEGRPRAQRRGAQGERRGRSRPRRRGPQALRARRFRRGLSRLGAARMTPRRAVVSEFARLSPRAQVVRLRAAAFDVLAH